MHTWMYIYIYIYIYLQYINSLYVFISVPQKSGTTKTHDMAFGMKAGPETAVDFQEQQLYLEV